MPNHVMLDLETLSTAPNAAVLSIGLAAFDDDQVIDTLGVRIDPKQIFGKIDTDTVAWWMSQSAQAKVYSFGGKEAPFSAWVQIAQFFTKHAPVDEVWANSPSFDCVIFKGWCDELVAQGAIRRGTPLPWGTPTDPGFRKERDFRTHIAEARRLGVPVDKLAPYQGTAHNPIDDAANQARLVIAVRKYMSSQMAMTRAA